MPTERLYYADAYLREFDATVVAHGGVGGRPAVALDRSAFYPEGGGQPGDTGALDACAVADTQAEGELVWHILARPEDLAALPVGVPVAGRIDWARRFDHMQQHCGQHILTAAFIAAAGLPTISFHLGAASVTIDLDTPELTPAQARAAEELANAVVWEDRPVTARFVGAEELARLPLRKAPTVAGPVRVVSVEGFDHSACGGTHPRSTGGVGLIAVLRWARQRGGTRVEFACGGRALAELRRLGAAAGAAAAALSVGVDELPAAAERSVAAQKAASKELAQARAALDEAEAMGLYAAGEPLGAARLVCAELPEAEAGRLRALAQGVAAQPGGVAILGTGGARAQLVVACAPDSGLGASELLRAGLPLVEGRGGGSAGLAQGGGPRVEGLATALAAMAAAARVG
ncbi:MAG TPA: alanine--tRNA ligase-related protein [Chloroflexaceae bacterium]|nr:alanine--tRNA ligase-related protein [Chloroflexaceae bacterium]